MWGSGLQILPTHSSTEAEYISTNTGTPIFTCMSILSDELRIPMKKRTATLVIDDKPSTSYYDGIIKKMKQMIYTYWPIPVENKDAFNITNSYGPSKRTKHMAVRHLYIQHQINKEVIRISLVPTTVGRISY